MPLLQWIFRQARRNRVLTFVIGVMGVWAVEQAAQAVLQTRGIWTLLLAIAIVVLAILLFTWIGRFISRLREPPRIHRGPLPGRRRGLIFLYSRPETFWKAVDYHRDRLEYVWLIVTPQIALDVDSFRDKLGRVEPFTVEIISAWHPVETAGAVKRALEHAKSLHIAPNDLICDVTGGTTAMTVGAVVACEREGLGLEMVPGLYDAVLNVQRPLEVMRLKV